MIKGNKITGREKDDKRKQYKKGKMIKENKTTRREDDNR